MTDRQLHLSFLQDVIKRMGQNSFLMKGWCVGIVTALLAFSGKEGLPIALKAAFLPIVFLWLVDGYYLSLERRYRKLYDEVRTRESPLIDFSLDTSNHRIGNAGFLRSVVAWPTLLFYFPLAGGLELIAAAAGVGTLTALAKNLITLHIK